jgi:putative nucleotidyltransferase with HDIG domain
MSMIVTGGHSRRLLLTLAALLHDVGKPDTGTVDPDGRVRFIGHEGVGAKMAADALQRLRFSGDAVRLVGTVIRHHLRPLALTWGGVASKRAIYRFFRDTRDAGVEIVLLSLADDRATVGYEDDADGSSQDGPEYQALLETARALLDAYFNHQGSVIAPAPLLTGRDLIDQFGLEQGPPIGRLLAALSEAQATGQVTTRQDAEEWARRTVQDWGLRIED